MQSINRLKELLGYKIKLLPRNNNLKFGLPTTKKYADNLQVPINSKWGIFKNVTYGNDNKLNAQVIQNPVPIQNAGVDKQALDDAVKKILNDLYAKIDQLDKFDEAGLTTLLTKKNVKNAYKDIIESSDFTRNPVAIDWDSNEFGGMLSKKKVKDELKKLLEEADIQDKISGSVSDALQSFEPGKKLQSSVKNIVKKQFKHFLGKVDKNNQKNADAIMEYIEQAVGKQVKNMSRRSSSSSVSQNPRAKSSSSSEDESVKNVKKNDSSDSESQPAAPQ